MDSQEKTTFKKPSVIGIKTGALKVYVKFKKV